MATFRQGFEFDAMARRPLYAPCPRWLIDAGGAGPDDTVVDLGCGSGVLTRALLDRFPGAGGPRVIAVDPSEWELRLLRQRIDDPRVTAVVGRAEDASELARGADVVLLCNVLHQIPRARRAAVLRGVFEALRPGGTIAFNTLFYDGSVREDPGGLYTRWMLAARRHLAARGTRVRFPDEPPVALQQWTAARHGEVLREIGYAGVVIEELETRWALEDWIALSGYSVFIEGALWPGVDLAQGREALIAGVREAYRDTGLQTVLRGWLHVAARRPRGRC